MATPTTFDTAYGVTPWEVVETKEETVHVPELLEAFRKNALYYGLVTYGVNLGAARTGQMVFTQAFDPEPNIATLDNRAIWLPQVYLDTRELRITALRYGDEFQVHKYDEAITYLTENRVAGLRNIVMNRMAPHMVETLDILARNAFIEKTSCMFAGGASSFNDLQADDTFEPGVARAVWLSADYMPDPVSSPILCTISPSALYTMRSSSDGEFISRMTYADPARLINHEVGMYEDVRFAAHPSNVLWNCGEILAQTTLTAALDREDGAPDPASASVDDVWYVGQADATHYITVADTSDFAAGDYVTLHQTRAVADGVKAVQNGVVWNHAKKIEREVHAVIDGTHMSLKKPVMVDYFDTDLGGGTYGYVTKARPVHVAIFLKGPQGVVSGVLMPPQTYAKEPIDTTNSIYRFGWDAYMKYQMMYPERFETYFYAGPVRRNNTVVNL